MCEMWCATNDVWGVMCYKWCVRCDVLQMMCEVWCVTSDVWDVMCGVCCNTCVAASGQPGSERFVVKPAYREVAPCPCDLTFQACDVSCCCDGVCLSACLSVSLHACMPACLSLVLVYKCRPHPHCCLPQGPVRIWLSCTTWWKWPAHCAVQYHPCRETVRRHQPNGQVLCMDYMQQHPTIQENKTNNKNPVALCQPSFTHALFNLV